MLEPNPGNRPSRLRLDRLATGELPPGEVEALSAGLSPGDRAHLEAAEAARTGLPAFDPAAIRARAARLPADPVPAAPPAAPRPANTPFAFLAALAALAAAALLAFQVGRGPSDPGPGDVRFKGGDALEVVELVGATPRGYVAGTPVGQGTVLGFRVNATGHTGVVLLSVDGRGEATVFWPASGEAPEPLSGDGLLPLDGSVVLDDAPGPEIFVAVYDRPVPDALQLVRGAWATGGPEGVLGTAASAPGVHAVEVTRR